jgi:hypothetical protein
MGAPPLEPEAGDWNDVADLKKKTGKKTQGGRDGGPGSTLRCFEACGATISTSRRKTEPMRFLLDEKSAMARRGQGLLAQVSILFFIYAVSGRRAFSSKMQGAHVATAGRRHAQYYSLSRSRDPALLLPAVTLVNLFSSDNAVPEPGAPPRRDAREEAALSATVGPSHGVATTVASSATVVLTNKYCFLVTAP